MTLGHEYCDIIEEKLQTFDVPASLSASTLVAMEITVSCLLKLGEYPNDLMEKVKCIYGACTGISCSLTPPPDNF